MIVVENFKVFNIVGAVIGARNPMNSWDKSDSCSEIDILGAEDLKLARKLALAGPDHGKFLRQILVSVDLTAPLYWWKEFDTYKVGTVANSTSTMHKIMSRDLTNEDFSCEHLLFTGCAALQVTIDTINEFRKSYLNIEDGLDKKTVWYNVIQLLPSSYNQKRTVTLNYEVLRNMYHARNNHKLDEWKKLCVCIERLPYSELITEERN